MAADHCEIVCELVSAQDRFVGKKNVSSKIIDKTRNLQSHFPWCVGDHSKTVVIPLRAGLILCARTELVIPGGLEIIVIVVNRTARRKSGQGLHVGRLLQVMSIPVGERKLVARVDAVVQSA